MFDHGKVANNLQITLCLIMSEMANLERVLGHSGRDDNLNTNSGGYFESVVFR